GSEGHGSHLSACRTKGGEFVAACGLDQYHTLIVAGDCPPLRIGREGGCRDMKSGKVTVPLGSPIEQSSRAIGAACQLEATIARNGSHPGADVGHIRSRWRSVICLSAVVIGLPRATLLARGNVR